MSESNYQLFLAGNQFSFYSECDRALASYMYLLGLVCLMVFGSMSVFFVSSCVFACLCVLWSVCQFVTVGLGRMPHPPPPPPPRPRPAPAPPRPALKRTHTTVS